MIVRIVKMTIQENNIDQYKTFTSALKPRIRAFAGCNGLDILQDVSNPAVLFSYSLWDSEAHLNHYRQSEFFNTSWTVIKQWFAAKPEAWSTEVV